MIKKTWSRRLFISTSILIFVLGVYGSLFDAIPNVLISRDEKGLRVLGNVLEVSGKASRKLVNDVLWFSLEPQDRVFQGDSLQTGKESLLSLEINNKSKAQINVSSETYIRLRLSMDKPAIQLLEGELELKGTDSDFIYVSAGLKLQKIQLKKGSVVRVRRNKDGSLDVEMKKMDLLGQEVSPEGVPQKQSIASSAPKMDLKMTAEERPIKYPYPEQQTVFFHRGSGRILVFPQKTCSEKCTLEIIKDSQESLGLYRFSASEEVVAKVDFTAKTEGVFTWTFEDGSQQSSGVFYLKPYSSSEIKKHISENDPIVIMGDL